MMVEAAERSAVAQCLGVVAARLARATQETEYLSERLESTRRRETGGSDPGELERARRAEESLERSLRGASKRLRALELLVAACVAEAARLETGAR